MLRIPVPRVILDDAQVMALVRQRIPAGMAEPVRMDLARIGALADAPDQVLIVAILVV